MGVIYMAKKEINTDLWVNELLKEAKINLTAQGCDIIEIDKALQGLETLFGENSKNKAKVEKYLHNQEEKAFVQSLSKKTVAQSEQKHDAAPKEEIKEEKENEMDDREL